jgi:hypothetical protein
MPPCKQVVVAVTGKVDTEVPVRCAVVVSADKVRPCQLLELRRGREFAREGKLALPAVTFIQTLETAVNRIFIFAEWNVERQCRQVM